MERVTIRDVAERAGVSNATVSRVFSDAHAVSPVMRDRVISAAEALGYRPNMLARSLIRAKTNLVALAVGETKNAYDSIFVDTLADALAERGKHLLLAKVRGGGPVDEALMGALDYQVDAAVVAAGTMTPEACARCARVGIPVVLCGRVPATLPAEPDLEEAVPPLPFLADSILADNGAGARMAADLLIRGGCRRIAYLGRSHRAFSDSERERGLRDSLAAQGMALQATARIAAGADGAYDAALRLLSAPEPPDGVFCMNDDAAMGVLQAAQALGIAVPDELAVIGFDNIPMAAWPGFRLTTIDYPISRTVETVIARIDARLADPARPPQVTRIPVRLMVRDTTRRGTGRPAVTSHKET